MKNKLLENTILGSLVILGLLFMGAEINKRAKVEGCQITMRDLYAGLDMKKVDEPSLKSYCEAKTR